MKTKKKKHQNRKYKISTRGERLYCIDPEKAELNQVALALINLGTLAAVVTVPVMAAAYLIGKLIKLYIGV